MIRLMLYFSFSKKHIDNYGFLIRFRCPPITFIQWGTADVGSSPVSVPLNIAYTTTYNGVCVDNGNYPTQNAIWSFTKKSLTEFTVSAYWPIDKKFLSGIVHWLTIGK